MNNQFVGDDNVRSFPWAVLTLVLVVVIIVLMVAVGDLRF